MCGNDTKYFKKEEAPEWISEMVEEAHSAVNDYAPNDFVYEMLHYLDLALNDDKEERDEIELPFQDRNYLIEWSKNFYQYVDYQLNTETHETYEQLLNAAYYDFMQDILEVMCNYFTEEGEEYSEMVDDTNADN